MMDTDENPIEAEIVIEYEDGSQKVIRKWKEPKTSVSCGFCFLIYCIAVVLATRRDKTRI